MKCIIRFKELYGNEIEKYEVEGKYFGDILQVMENKLCSEIAPYNNYSLKNCRNIDKKASKKTLHFKDSEGNILSYVIEIINVQYLKKNA